MSSTPNDSSAKEKAKRALVLNKIKPEATPFPKNTANKKSQPTQKTYG